MNRESEEDMARDVKENEELYQAFVDGNEEDNPDGASKTFWWSEQGRLDSLWEHLAIVLSLMWIALVLASLSTLFVRDSLSLAIIWVFLIGCTIMWWFEIKRTEEWLGEHYGDWNE
jgi:hypothetical protein